MDQAAFALWQPQLLWPGAVRPVSRLIFSFMSTTLPWPVSGPMCCAFNARTAEPNMRLRCSGLPRSHSRTSLSERLAEQAQKTSGALGPAANQHSRFDCAFFLQDHPMPQTTDADQQIELFL